MSAEDEIPKSTQRVREAICEVLQELLDLGRDAVWAEICGMREKQEMFKKCAERLKVLISTQRVNYALELNPHDCWMDGYKCGKGIEPKE